MATKKKQQKGKKKDSSTKKNPLSEVRLGIITHAHSMIDFDVHWNHMKCVYEWAKKWNFRLYGYKGLMAAEAREMCFDDAIKDERTHVFVLDADHFIPIEALEFLLENKDEAMVSGLICRRVYPFEQVAYGKHDRSGGYSQIEIPIDGQVYEVGACAFGCTLINLEKLQKLEKPWFRDTCDKKYDGKLHNIRSDINLCDMFRASGEKVWIDTRLLVVHEGSSILVAPQNSRTLKGLMDFYGSTFELRPGQHHSKFAIPGR